MREAASPLRRKVVGLLNASLLCCFTFTSFHARGQAAPPPAVTTSAPAPSPASPAPTPTPGGCFPDCRVGYVCVQGQCVSACNPPCEAGRRCTAAATCEVVQAAPAPAPAPVPAASPMPYAPAPAPVPGVPTAPAPAPPAGTVPLSIEGPRDKRFDVTVSGAVTAHCAAPCTLNVVPVEPACS